MEMRQRGPQYLRLHPQVRKDSRLEPKAWSQFSTSMCLGYLYAPGLSAKFAAPVGGGIGIPCPAAGPEETRKEAGT